MEIEQAKAGDLTVVALRGRFDVSNPATVQERILRVIEAGERRLIIDLSGLEYVNSAGLRVFMTAAKRMKTSNGKIVLAGLNNYVRELFEIAGFTSLFSIYPSREEAAQALQQISAS